MVLTDVYKYFRTAFVNVPTVYGSPNVVAHTTMLATFGKMINRRDVRNSGMISIIRGQLERLIRASVTFFCTSLADIVLRVDNRVGIDDRAGFTR